MLRVCSRFCKLMAQLHESGQLRLVERGVVLLPEQGLANRGQNLIIIVVPNVEGEVPEDPFERAGTVQASRTARPYASFHCLFGQMLHGVTGTAASKARLVMASCFPHARHVVKPQVPRLHIDCALGDVLLYERITALVLGGYIFDRKLVSRFRGSQKSCSVMGNEAGLPAIEKILAGPADYVAVGNKGLVEAHHVAGSGPHANGIPPGTINAYR